MPFALTRWAASSHERGYFLKPGFASTAAVCRSRHVPRVALGQRKSKPLNRPRQAMTLGVTREPCTNLRFSSCIANAQLAVRTTVLPGASRTIDQDRSNRSCLGYRPLRRANDMLGVSKIKQFFRPVGKNFTIFKAGLPKFIENPPPVTPETE